MYVARLVMESVCSTATHDRPGSTYSTTTYESDEDEDNSLFDKMPDFQQQIEEIDWFHPNLSRHHSDALLRAVEEGVFLLRKRTRGWGLYSLDVKYKHSVKHFPVSLTENGITFGGERSFPCVDTFVKHFQTNPLLGDESGSFIQCIYPYPRSVSECDVYEAVTCHFLFGGDVGSDDETSEKRSLTVGFSAATKEGYIRKQGGKIKSWKTRWFVLKDDSISYYPNHKSKKPIRQLKISEIVYILGDDSTKSFRIVLPWRTFYLEAPTAQNKKEWVEILRWKLDEHQKRAKKLNELT